jgi:hypothetical protein
MAPINLPNGSDANKVILPDGKNASKVIGPDGIVLFNPLAAEGVLQYTGSIYSDGSTTWTDDNNVADMTLTGDENASTLSDGVASVKFNGTDDHGLITLPQSLEGSSLNAHTFEIAIQTTTTENFIQICGGRNTDSNQEFAVWFNLDGAGNSNGGHTAVDIRDDTGVLWRFGTDSQTSPNLNDGNRHDITYRINDAGNNSADIIIDGNSVSLETSSANSLTNFTSWDVDFAVGASNGGGSIGSYAAVNIGAIRWHDQATTEQTIDQY